MRSPLQVIWIAISYLFIQILISYFVFMYISDFYTRLQFSRKCDRFPPFYFVTRKSVIYYSQALVCIDDKYVGSFYCCVKLTPFSCTKLFRLIKSRFPIISWVCQFLKQVSLIFCSGDMLVWSFNEFFTLAKLKIPITQQQKMIKTSFCSGKSGL